MKKERNLEIKRQYEEGKSTFQLAEIFHLTHQRVSQILQSLDVEARQIVAEIRSCIDCHCPVKNGRKNGNGFFNWKKKTAICFDCNTRKKEELNKFWAPKLKLYECVVCKSAKRRHVTGGKCSVCFSRHRYHSNEKYRKIHSERVKDWMRRNKKRYDAHFKQYRKEYARKNKDKINAINRANYKINREKILARNRKWYAENKNKS